MGTFLGNLQVLNAGAEEVSALFPKAIVGQWSERFVSVLDENFGLGATVDRPARSLSKKLPEAVVLSVGLADSDLLELAVWQNGKRLTARAHFPYDGASKRGDPKVFCEALGLPAEDEKRLKAVWAKGDAEEQLDLTAALLGVQLYADPRCVPEKMAVRDEACVDTWLARHPDPPKVKNKTRAELIQELDRGICGYGWGIEGMKGAYLFHPPLGDGWFEEDAGQMWKAGPDGTLICEITGGLHSSWHYRTDGTRVLGFDAGPGGEPRWMLVYDSMGVLSVPLDLGNIADAFHSAPDGGLTVWQPKRYGRPDEIRRVAPNGTAERIPMPERCDDVAAVLEDRAYLWQARSEEEREEKDFYRYFCVREDGTLLAQGDLPWNAERKLWDEDGFFFTAPVCDGQKEHQYDLFRVSPELESLASLRLPGYTVTDLVWNTDRTQVFHAGFNQGIWLLDGNDLSIRASVTDRRGYSAPIADGLGRFWVWTGDSTVEAYDPNLTLLSRHRLKGAMLGQHLDEQGRLCAVTYDAKKCLVRVYRLA